MPYTSPHSKQAGFTFVEMLVVAPIVILLIASLVGVIIAITGDVLATREKLLVSYTTQDALNRIEQDIRLSNRFLAQNTITLTAPQGYDNGTDSFTNIGLSSGNALILRGILTDKRPTEETRELVYQANSPNPCGGSLVSYNTPYYSNIVYFIKNNALYRRVLLPYNPTNGPCLTPWQQPSCSPGQINNTSCKVEDALLLQNVSSMNITYYETANSTTPLTAATSTSGSISDRETALLQATTASVSLSTVQSAAGQNTSFDGTLRATLINMNATIN